MAEKNKKDLNKNSHAPKKKCVFLLNMMIFL